MFRHTLIFLLLAVPGISFAQGSATLSGRTIAQETAVPLPLVSIVVEDVASGAAVTGAITNDQGRFSVAGLDPGDYRIIASSDGYQPQEIAVLIGDKNDIYSVGDISLVVVDAAVEEIVVTGAQVAGADLDQKVFRLDDNFAQASGSLLDALKGLPGVTVDQEGKVILRGSDRVAILIDGKPSSLTGYGNQRGLDNVPAANAESIEIINNPSARYDASGMAGIINIVYKKDNEVGFSGDVGLTVGAGHLSKPRQDLPTELGSFSVNQKIIPSLNLNYNTGTVRSFLQSEILIQDDLPNNEFTTRFYDDGRIIESQVPENREQTHYIVKAGVDWTISADRLFSVSAIYDFETHTDRAEVPFIDADTMTLNRFWFWREKEDTGFANISFNYKMLFAEAGHELRTDIQYTRGWEDEAYFLNEESAVRIGTDATHLVATEHTVPVSLDYIRPMRAGRMEAGLKYQARWIPITYDVTPGVGSVIYPGLGDWSEWSEDIYAGYLSYVHETSDYDIEAGVRVEQTDVEYDIPPENIYYSGSDNYDYLELYPNIKLTYQIDGENNMIAAYNRRVDRPGEPQLRIFPKYDDPELLKVGNPYLRPQFTDAFEIGYERLWDSGSISTAFYFRDIDDPFLRVFASDDSNVNYDIVNKIYQNVGSAAHSGIEILFTQDINESWRASGSLNWFRNKIDAYQTDLLFPTVRPFLVAASDDNTWDLKLNNSISLPRNSELQLSYVYYAERNIPQGVERPRSSFDIGIKTLLWSDRGELTFSFVDVFNDFGLEQMVTGDGFTAVYQNYYETQVVSVGVKYRF